jgi:carbon monoxide dehydrogenase subunit G
LEHRFEVPVGIDQAWLSLLDMSQVAACFPGATLTSSDGEEYRGSVRVKLGPIQLTYQGKAQIVEADESAHRAVIEASGQASRSASTANMKVVATASPVTDDRTSVDMHTSLTITGRPAQFGRGVMVEVGNKILGHFADCLAGKLAAGAAAQEATAASQATAGEATAAAPEKSGAVQTGMGATTEGSDAGSSADGEPASPPASSEGSSESPAEEAAGSSSDLGSDGGAATTSSGAEDGESVEPAAPSGISTQASPATSKPSAAAASPQPAVSASDLGSATGTAERQTTGYTRAPEPIDLLGSAGPSILKRLVPLIAGLIFLIVLRAIFNRRRGRAGA